MSAGVVTVWLAAHPRARRAVVGMTLTYTLALVGLVCAPRALAAGGSAVLGWTGLHDSDQVPLSWYYLSLVSVREAATNNGAEVSVIDPGSWGPWMAAALERAVDNATAAWWLSMFAATFLFLMSAALWFLRFALSTGWLAAIATFAVPLYHAVSAMVSSLMLGPIAITVCAVGAGYHILRGHPGRGWAMIGTAVALTVLLNTVFADPIGVLFSDHGLLALGRGTGLEIAQGAIGAPFASGASLDARIDALLSQVVTASVRHPLQVMNFGMVVDDIGGCRQAWSQAILASGGMDGPGPAHAMDSCGAPQAMAFAQRLGGSDATVGLALLGVAMVTGFFIFYVGLSVMLVGIKSLYYGLLVGPAFLAGMAGFGRALGFAKHCGTEVFMHLIQVMVFEVYLAVSAIGLTWVLTTNALVGTSSQTAIARVLMMAIAAGVLWLGFRVVDKSFHVDGLGTIGRQVRGAWQAGTGTLRPDPAGARRPADSDAGGGAPRGSGQGATADSGGPGTGQRTPGFEWFKPRWTRAATPAAATADTAAGSGPAGSSGAARSPATSAASAATRTAAKAAAPQASATAAAAGAAGRSNGSAATTSPPRSATAAAGTSAVRQPDSPARGCGGNGSARPPSGDDRPATTAASGRDTPPAQATSVPTRRPTAASSGPTAASTGRPASANPQRPGTPGPTAGTIEPDDDQPQRPSPQPGATRLPQPPREIGT